MMKIMKKDGSHELFNEEKIIKAVKKLQPFDYRCFWRKGAGSCRVYGEG